MKSASFIVIAREQRIVEGMAKYVLALLILLAIGALGARQFVPMLQPAPSESSTTIQQNPTSGEKLDRSNQGLSKFPTEILTQRSLTELNLSHNNLSGAMPAEIRLLSRLQVLDISDNRYTGIPAEVRQLRELRVLNAANNQLTGLPLEIGNLSKLEQLNLAGNNISSIDLEKIRAALPASTEIIQ